MRYIDCQVTDEYVLGGGVVIGAAGSKNDVALRLAFGEMWQDYIDNGSLKIQWVNSLGTTQTDTILDVNPGISTGVTIDSDGRYIVPIPAAPKQEPGVVTMSIKGFILNTPEDESEEAQEIQATLTVQTKFKVLNTSSSP